ncbi:MAG: hypothetical protein QOG57_6954, partial [Pseudonocardiales bacterium]|nr:hypothetical protein [Pseudonocardiales bacterium]
LLLASCAETNAIAASLGAGNRNKSTLQNA